MSTVRQEFRAGMKVVIDGVKAANPSKLAHTYDHRPGSLRTPCAFIDNDIRTVEVQHDAGTRLRTLEGEAHFVNKAISMDQLADEQDALADLAEDAFTAAPRTTSNSTMTQHIGVINHTEVDNDASYGCTVVTVRTRVQEGRP